MRPIHTAMTDYERIITEIAHNATSSISRFHFGTRDTIPKLDRGYTWSNDVQVGDIVRCNTQRRPEWMFSWLEGVDLDHHEKAYLLRGIGSTKRVRMSNESLYSLPFYQPLEGFQWRAYEVCVAAANEMTDMHYSPRWGGMKFPNQTSRDGVCELRYVFGLNENRVSIPIRATSRLTFSSVYDAMETAWNLMEKS